MDNTKKKIIVAGAGHGGLTAAYNLAKKGYDVTVYERLAAEGDLGHDWQDYFDYKAWAASGLPLPPSGVKDRASISFRGPDLDTNPITQSVKPGEYEMYMYRKDIYAHLLKYCHMADVKFVFGCDILAPILLGSRVVGIKTSMGDFLGDLIIDAAGVDSPLRTQLPEHLHIQNKFADQDCLYAYRAYYNRLEGYEDVPNDYDVYFIVPGNVGLHWVITNEDCVDVLIGRFSPLSEDEIQKSYDVLKQRAPQIGDKILHGGYIGKIPVREPLSVMVADGYAAVGDSACMTVPIVGSGIANSLRAGAMLAKAVLKDINGEYTADTLWSYQVDYYKNIGSAMCVVCLVKELLNKLTIEDMSFLFRSNIFNGEDLSFNSSESSLKAMFANLSFGDIVDRLKKVGSNSALLRKVGSAGVSGGKLKLMMTRFPSKYSKDGVAKWAEKYDQFFTSILADEPDTEEDLF